MLAWILYFIFKNGWTNQKAGKRPASIASNRSRLLRKSIKDLSAEVGAPNTFRTQKPRHQQWFDGVNCLFEPDKHIFERIFQYLDPSDAVKILSLCQSWSVPAVEAFYETPFLYDPDSFGKLASLLADQHTTHPYAFLVREVLLPMPVAGNLMMGDLKDVLQSCPNLISLRIEGCTQLSNLLSGLLTEHVPFLYRLELPGCFVSDSFVGTLITGCNSIRHIDLSNTNVTLSCLPILIHDCKLLETLDLTAAKSPEKGSSAQFGIKEAEATHPARTHLKRVSLSNTDTTDNIVAYLVQCCNNLEALLLDNCPYITDSGISFIAQHCPRIQVLGLSFCPISDVGLQSLAVHLSNHAHPKQSLKPRRKSIGVQPTSYSSLQEFKETPAAIEKVQLCEIYLAGCYRITPKGLTLVAETCPDLDVIVLDGCDLLLCWYHQAQGHTQIEDEEVLTLTRKQIMDVKLKK